VLSLDPPETGDESGVKKRMPSGPSPTPEESLESVLPLLIHPSQLTQSQRDDVDGRVY